MSGRTSMAEAKGAQAGNNLTRAEYLLFRELISQASGLDLQERDWTPLRAAVCERVAATGSASYGAYYQLLRSAEGATETARLIELLTVHETAFFRNRGHFEVLRGRIIPELLTRNSDSRTLRIWSAGCSTGQESYSIAISLLESVPDIDSWRIEVLATDISHRALEFARRGVYPARALRDLDPELLDRYFRLRGDEYEVCELAKRLVRFEYLNLVKEPFPLAALRPVDVIFCENVTIYFKVESTRRVIRNFYEVLREGGYLFLGYSETLWQISSDFLLREMDNAFVYQRPLEQPVSGMEQPTPEPLPGAGKGPGSAPETRLPRRRVLARAVRPSGPPATLEDVVSLYEARRFEEALLAVESVLSASPGDARAQLLAAKLRADREEVGPALRHCRRALQTDPLLEEGHYLMGVLLLRSGDYREASEAFSRVVYLSPSGYRAALAHFHLAGVHADAGDRVLAIREYRNAARLLERLPKDELLEEFSADFLARVCRRRLEELGVGC